jgi:short-subunit dehydrogenase involved in D-alanine esterification of teichoic acids
MVIIEQKSVCVMILTAPAVLITGTSLNGIGFETARVLAKHANIVFITGHNSDRLKLIYIPGYLLNVEPAD